MQHMRKLWFLLPWMFLVTLHAQNKNESHPVQVTVNKTSTVIFDAGILSVDRGSRDVIAQKVKGLENVLQLKASRKGFPETNLTVITMDGKVHEFSILYSGSPETMVVEVRDIEHDSRTTTPLRYETNADDARLRLVAEQIARYGTPRVGNTVRNHKMKMMLQGIYVQGDMLYCRVAINNNADISYDVVYRRWSIRDKKTAKRTASQEIDVIPVYVHGNDRMIRARDTNNVVYVMNKFTIPDAKHLVLEVLEKDGGRNLQLRINNRKLMHAKPVRGQASR